MFRITNFYNLFAKILEQTKPNKKKVLIETMKITQNQLTRLSDKKCKFVSFVL